MLWQFRCAVGGTLFYYQWGSEYPPAAHIITHCPVCKSVRVTLTGRKFPDLDEYVDQPQPTTPIPGETPCASFPVR